MARMPRKARRARRNGEADEKWGHLWDDPAFMRGATLIGGVTPESIEELSKRLSSTRRASRIYADIKDEVGRDVYDPSRREDERFEPEQDDLEVYLEQIRARGRASLRPREESFVGTSQAADEEFFRKQAELDAGIDRAAALFKLKDKKPPGFIRKAPPGGRHAQALGPAVNRAGAVFFGEQDPPRVSRDRKNFCGNPIDATAYYVALSAKRRPIYSYLSASGKRSDETIDQYLNRVEKDSGVKPRPSRLENLGQITRIRKEQGVAAGHIVERQARIAQRKIGSGYAHGSDVLIAKKDKEGKWVPVGPTDYSRAGRSEVAFFIPQVYMFVLDGNSMTTQLEKLKGFFQPFASHSFVVDVEAPVDQLLAENLNMPRRLARLLILSGHLVMELTTASTRGKAKESLRQPILNPDALPTLGQGLGTTLHLTFGSKESSPYFSWIQTQTPMYRGDTGNPEFVCLTDEDEQLLHILRKADTNIGSFVGQMQAIQSMAGLVQEGATSRVDFRISGLSRGIASIQNWWADVLAGKGTDPIGERLTAVTDAELAMDFVLMGQEAEALGLVVNQSGHFLQTVFHDDPEKLPEFVSRVRERVMSRRSQTSGALGSLWLPVFEFLHTLAHYDPRDPSRSRIVDPLGGAFPVDPRAEGATRTFRQFLPFEPVSPELPPEADDARQFEAYIQSAEEAARYVPRERADQILAALQVVRNLIPVVVNRGELLALPYREHEQEWEVRARQASEDRAGVLRQRIRQQQELALLYYLYFELEGPRLIGSLSPATRSGPGPLVQFRESIRREILQLRGGTGLSESSDDRAERTKFHVFKTYNPALYELTRLYWNEEGKWNGFWPRPELLNDLDVSGRYGAALELVNDIGIRSSSAEQMQATLTQDLKAVASKFAKAAEEGEMEMVSRVVEGRGRLGLIRQLWPLGSDWRGAVNEMGQLAENPLGKLEEMKNAYSASVAKAGAYGSRGLPSLLSRKPGILEAAPQKEGPKFLDPMRDSTPGSPQEQALGRVAGALSRIMEVDATGLLHSHVLFRQTLAAFQKRNRLPANGLIDSHTLAVLEEQDRVRPTSITKFWGDQEFDSARKLPYSAVAGIRRATEFRRRYDDGRVVGMDGEEVSDPSSRTYREDLLLVEKTIRMLNNRLV